MSAPLFPVSIKGVMAIDGRIPLLFNERDEWELPGGRLEAGEQPEAALVRELAEELNIETRIERILDSWLYRIAGKGEVMIVTYACSVLRADGLRFSPEHQALRLVAPAELEGLNLPSGYRHSIQAFLAIY
ncbi:MAG: hydrolase [Alphaproteobacteria bacterium]|jgi:8-oxo-dGTP pyrophosphatase MutT (NUDIX family)|nr:hydrolase [Alphaproteobacteria bacterium]